MRELQLRAVGSEGLDVVARLRQAYDRGAAQRDRTDKAPWKLAEREAFLARLRDGDCVRLLELGAGTGQDSEFFQHHGLDVVAVDLSPAMVERCRRKGIDARVMDFRHPDFPPESFDAAYALNDPTPPPCGPPRAPRRRQRGGSRSSLPARAYA
jgi:SAM-dependent methyltransferase